MNEKVQDDPIFARHLATVSMKWQLGSDAKTPADRIDDAMALAEKLESLCLFLESKYADKRGNIEEAALFAKEAMENLQAHKLDVLKGDE